jgi:hypothetical protein
MRSCAGVYRQKKKSTAPARAVPIGVRERCTFNSSFTQTSYRQAANAPSILRSIRFSLFRLDLSNEAIKEVPRSCEKYGMDVMPFFNRLIDNC